MLIKALERIGTRFLKKKRPHPLAQEENHAVAKQFRNFIWLSTFINRRAKYKNLKKRKKNGNAA